MNKEELERLYMDIYDNGISDNDYKEKFKRYVNNRFESLEKENAELREQVERMSELINRYYMVCSEMPKEFRTMTFDSCLEDTVKMVRDREVKE